MSMTTPETDTSHGDWGQYYQRDLAAQPPGGGGGFPTRFDSPLVYSSTVLTATVTPAGAPAAGSGGGGEQQAGDGRAGRATSRRRSRPSRKPPTDLINTDAANFRDMVQRYTGAPQETFQTGYHLKAPSAAGGASGGPATPSFGLSAGMVLLQQPAAFPYGSQQQQYLQYQQHHERPSFMLGGGAEDAELFLQGFGGGKLQRGGMEVSEGYLMEGTSSSHVLPRAPASGGGGTTGGLFLR